MKLISVIMPCYNSNLYIREAIQSILNQTYSNFELLVLDDGSTDGTKSIVLDFKDARIKYYCEIENKGIVYQLNKGIENAKGEFIARMDADDISLPERFQKQIDFLEDPKNHKIDVLGTDAVSIGKETSKIQFQNYKPNQISFLLNFFCPILHPTVMMRSKIFQKGLKYSDEYKYAEDLALWRMIDNAKNIAILKESLLQYRIHQNQTNSNEIRKEVQKNSTLNALAIKSKRKKFKSYWLPIGIGQILWYDYEKGTNKVSTLIRFIIKIQLKMLDCKSSMVLMLLNK
jgi:glycosyltransferase involved in cell wall biosynthesis